MKQLNIFDFISKEYKIKKPIRLIELFAGIGSQAKALERLGANFEHYRVVEFDKYAIKSYNAIHGTNFETSDITKITADYLGIEDTWHYKYIVTYSFPCQDLSLAGKGKGMEKGSGTRSGLLWEVERLLNECKELPQILLMENVPQVHSKKNIEHFNKWITALQQLGYSNYYEDLNAKNYGIPQNRNRCFMVSILGDYEYSFPKPFELKLKLKDMLQDNPNGEYNLQKMKKFFIEHSYDMEAKGNGFRFEPHVKTNAEVAKCLTTRAGSRMDDNFVIDIETNLNKFKFDTTNKFIEKVGENYYLSEKMIKYIVADNDKWTGNNDKALINKNIASTINTGEGRRRCDASNYISSQLEDEANLKEVLRIKNNTKQGYLEATEGDGVDISSRMHHHRGMVQKEMIQTLDTQSTKGVVVKDKINTNDLRIRKLTPLECFRLMGFDDEDFEKAAKVNSNTQLYKQAGNSIVVNVLEEIFKQLL